MKRFSKIIFLSLVLMFLFLSNIDKSLAFPNETSISLNTDVTGQLDSDSAVNYYTFTLSSPGKVSVEFNHMPVNSGDWEIQIWDSTFSLVEGSRFTSSASNSTVTSNNVRIPVGTYYMKVNKRPYYNFSNINYTIKVNFTAENELSYEKEPNDNATTNAYPIVVNTAYTGNLASENDADYYNFTLSSPSKLSVNFRHMPVSSGDWEIQVWDSTYTLVEGSDFASGASDSTVTSNNVRVPSGTYYVKVIKRPYYNFSNIDYKLTVNVTYEDQYYEKNPNEEPSTAYPINVNTTYTGNLASDNDVDFYSFALPSASTVSVDFGHIPDGSGDWQIQIWDSNYVEVKGSDFTSCADDSIITSSEINLPAGTYYVKVNKRPYYNFSNTDYTLKINSSKSDILLDDCQITGNTIPATMTAGHSYTVSITIKNTGTTNWTADQGYILAAAGNSDSFAAIRQPLDSSDCITPGQSKTFTFQMISPADPRLYTSDWQMLHQGAAWFGQPLAVNIKVSAASPTQILYTTGHLNSDTDINYETFTLPSPGRVAVSFGHVPTSSGDWAIQIVDSQYTTVNGGDCTSGANDSIVTTNNVRLPGGTYYVKVNKRPYYNFSNIDYTLSVNFTPEGQYYEKIPNEDPSTAYPINVNTTYTGNLASDNDVDFYTFTLPSSGKVSVNFRHIPVSSGDWEIQIWDSKYTTADGSNITPGAGNSTVTSNNIRLPAGTYYVKVNKRPYYNFSNVDYHLTVNFTLENQYYEKNPNEDPSTAYPINLNTAYTGNLASDSDVDFYTFTLPSSDKVSINFRHIPVSSGDWEIQVWDSNYTTVNEALFTSGPNDASLMVNDITLETGTYYVKVNKRPYYNFSNADYLLTIKGSSSGTPGGTDECFIATAAFGSKFTWPVTLLRHFRDQYLLTNSWGTAFVKFYYHHSPPIAAFIAGSKPLKIVVRILLAPIIALVYIVYHPIIMAIMLVLFVLFFSYRSRLCRKYVEDYPGL